MYFADLSKPGEHVPITTHSVTARRGSPVDLQIEIRTRSVDDRNAFAPLVIDDYRYDEPNHFADKRVPNVTFEVTDSDGRPAPFRAASQGGGASLEYLDVHVALDIGGDPERLERETNEILQEVAVEKLRPEEAIPRIEAIQRTFAPNQPGTYRVRAIYRPKVPGKWTGELSTAPISIVVADAK